jgi:membrane protein
MRRGSRIVKRAALAFYSDQGTHHAAALTYYCLMSLFPAALIAVSLLGLVGQYPRTYTAILDYLRDVAPEETLDLLDSSLRSVLRDRGTAAGALALSAVVALYGTTGVLEAARRAFNVFFEVDGGRGFVARKAVDIASTLVLTALVLAALTLMFVGGDFAEGAFDLLGLGTAATDLWNIVRWPAAMVVAVVLFSWLYYVTPDVHQRGILWVAPGAATGVAIWIAVSLAFSFYISNVANVAAFYGAFASVIVLLVWVWLTNVALLFGAEINAEIEREKELSEGVAFADTLDRPPRRRR